MQTNKMMKNQDEMICTLPENPIICKGLNKNFPMKSTEDVLKETQEQHRTIRQDINLIEYPIWLIDDRKKLFTYSIKLNNGVYTLRCYQPTTESSDENIQFLCLPTIFDYDVLRAVLWLAKETKNRKVLCKVSDIVKIMSVDPNGRTYKKVKQALYKWRYTNANFEGLFYLGDTEYSSINLSFFDEISRSKTHKSGNAKIHLYEILINEKIFEMLDRQGLTMPVNVKRELDPKSQRIKDYLSKQFFKRSVFCRNTLSFFDKVTISCKPPCASIIKRRVKTVENCIVRINKTVKGFQYSVEYDNEKQNIIFRKNNIKSGVQEELVFDVDIEIKNRVDGLNIPIQIFIEYHEGDANRALNALEAYQNNLERGVEVGNPGAYFAKLYEASAGKKTEHQLKQEQIEQERKSKNKQEEEEKKLKDKYDEFIQDLVLTRYHLLSDSEKAQNRKEFERDPKNKSFAFTGRFNHKSKMIQYIVAKYYIKKIGYALPTFDDFLKQKMADSPTLS